MKRHTVTEQYIERKVIATGAVARGDNGEGGTEKYLLPWIWDSETGDEVDATKE